MAFYSGVSVAPGKKHPVTAPSKEGGRMTACTIAVGDGMDWGEVIQVTSNGELSVSPDHCRLIITVSGSKESVQDVKNSVTRRLDYVLQTLRNYQIKVSKVEI